MTGGGVLEELLGRLSLPGWVQLVLGSHVGGVNLILCAKPMPTTR